MLLYLHVRPKPISLYSLFTCKHIYLKKNITATHRLVFSEDPNIIALIELFIIKQFRETPYFQTISF